MVAPWEWDRPLCQAGALETMLFTRKPMETYRNQSQTFMGIKLIHVWYIPTVWCFWELSTGVLWESSLSMDGPKQSMELVYLPTFTKSQWYAIQFSWHTLSLELLVCLMICTEPVLWRNCNSSQQMTQLDNNSAFTPYSAWRRIVARIDQPLAFFDRRFALQIHLVRGVMLSLHKDTIM